MSRSTSIAFSTGLIGAGVLAWAFAGRPLVANPNLNAPLNPLGINGSPYGEVFAMAMQGPIDSNFHVAWSGGGHQHSDGSACGSCGNGAAKAGQESKSRFQNLLATLEAASEVRTNPKSASDAHKRYLRRQVEDKLRFAYQLDPSHYANYNSLHFFLTEPQLGTRPELTPSAARLAEDTIRYCLKQDNDPRPALTAAAAVSNILELMFNDQRNPAQKFNTEQMRQYLSMLDYCIGRYASIAKQWDEAKSWERISPQRITECNERFTFICRFRDAAAGSINRFEGKGHAPQASN